MTKPLKRFALSSLVLLVCAFVCPESGLADSSARPDDDALDNLIVGARAIVRGKVVAIESRIDHDQDRIFTYVTLRVNEVLKGQITERNIVIKEEGGEVGDRGLVIFGAPEFRLGQRVLLYLDTWPDGSLRTHQMFLGKFRIARDQTTGARFVVPSEPESNVALRNGPGRSARGAAGNRVELGVYTRTVRERLAANWDRAQEFEARYYRDVPLLSRPEEYDRASRSGEMQPQFTFYPAAAPARWFEPDSGQPVTFFVNPDQAPNPQIVDDVTAAMNAWSTVPGCTLRMVNGGAAPVCPNDRTTNAIVFNNCDSRFAPTPDCAQIIAIGGLFTDGSQNRRVNGQSFRRVIRAFISFNPYSACSYANHCDVGEITTHELGHSVGLGHSADPTATMTASAHFDARCASLRRDDVNAIVFVYPVEDLGDRPLTITSPATLGDGVIAREYLHVFEAFGGGRPYSWNWQPGLDRVPTGLTLMETGTIIGLPTVVGTFNFIAKLTDSRGTSVLKTFSITIQPSPVYNSQYVSQSVPTMLKAGEQFNVSMTWLNTGTETWNGSAGFKLVSQNPANNSTWGNDRVVPLTSVVGSRQQFDLMFGATAPRTPGTYNFQWQLFQDGTGFFGQPSANVSILVTAVAPVIEAPASLQGAVGVAFRHQLTALGGTPPLTWSITSGALPAGVGLNAMTGLLSGTPTASGTFPITVQATDAQSQTAQKAITILVVAPPLEVATPSLPSGVAGMPFNAQLTATGGKPPYTWSVTVGALPGGLNLNSATGIISGTPNAAGNFGFTVTATDSESRTASKGLSITVIPPPLRIDVTPSIQGVRGTPLNYQPTASGGTPPYTWSMAGALPAGLSFSASTGAVSGTATASGTFNISITVRDQASAIASGPLQIRIVEPALVPQITSVKYKKGKRKLTVKGERIDATAVLVIDGSESSVGPDGGSFVVKKLRLATGEHEIRIVNPGGVSSSPYILNVN
ncbi:MAG TPA: putative Ig domain-containing protein [Blastocatellia bacterium]|nr:putative Ig domain-containing protein [Blastocatellia bacterium]